MSASAAQQKAPWILAALLLSQVMLMSTNARDHDSEQSVLRVWMVTAFAPIVRVSDSVFSSIKGTGSAISISNMPGKKRRPRESRSVDCRAEQRAGTSRRARFAAANSFAHPPSVSELAANVISRDAKSCFVV